MENTIIYGQDIATGEISLLKSSNNVLLVNSSSSSSSNSITNNPLGSILQFGPDQTKLPTGWLICDGSAISRTTYQDLYSIIGTKYGSGDGSTTFNLPDLRTRVPVGYNSTGTFNLLGKTGGAENHTLSIDEMAIHNHTFVDNYFSAYDNFSNSNLIYGNPFSSVSNSRGQRFYHDYTSENSGSSQSHNNLQPYIVINYIIYSISNTNNPIGSIITYAGNNTPDNLLYCDGSAISRTTYSNLFSIIGITYGSGDGSTTFNLPDLRTRVPVGYNSSGTFNALGKTGGSETHTLIVDELPSHNHTYQDIYYTSGFISDNPFIFSRSSYDTNNILFTQTLTSNDTGSSNPHNNLQPYIVLNYLIYFNITTIHPFGTITSFAGSTSPTGWLLCDGSAISRTTYSNLFSIIGITYGSGDGSTTFNLPDLRTRVPVGYNSSGTFNLLGKTGGSETHTLTVDELPSHNHTYRDDYNSANNINFPSGTEIGDNEYSVSGPSTKNYLLGITGTMDNTGNNAPHNNLQPYIVLNYIIYHGVGIINLNYLSDVSISNPVSNQLLKYNGSQWNNSTINTSNLSDVSISTPTTGEVLSYNSSTSKWSNKNNSLANLTDASISTPTTGEVLSYNSSTSKWSNKNNSLANLTDASISTLTTGQVLSYNSSTSKWNNSTIPIGGCYNGYILGNASAVWGTNASPGATTGTVFNVPIAGNYVINVSASAYKFSSTGMIQINIWINGTNTTYSLKLFANELGSHKNLVPISFKYSLNAGNNYLYLQNTPAMTSDLFDFASFNWVYSPF